MRGGVAEIEGFTEHFPSAVLCPARHGAWASGAVALGPLLGLIFLHLQMFVVH